PKSARGRAGASASQPRATRVALPTSRAAAWPPSSVTLSGCFISRPAAGCRQQAVAAGAAPARAGVPARPRRKGAVVATRDVAAHVFAR
nr:hypothetical protein [Tanacetum cinerariifolium]